MNYADPQEAMESLMGRKLVDWGRDEAMYHVTLDDGRMLVFVALGVVYQGDRAIR